MAERLLTNGTTKKGFSQEQMGDAINLLAVINSAPPERRSFIITMASAFIEGIEAGRILSEAQKS